MFLKEGPSPTKDIERAKLDLSKYGFCFIPEVLNATELGLAKERLLEQAEAEEEQGLSFRDGGPDQELKLIDGRIDKDSFTALNGITRNRGVRF